MTLVYLVAGEQSGDVLGARLMAALRAARPDLAFAGVGGPRMQAQGLQSLFPMRDLAVMGLAEVLPRLALLRRRMAETVADIEAKRPDVVVTVDSPSFGLRLLRRIPRCRRVQYVAPQAWGWREGRVRRFPGLWDRLLCLLPFEPGFFARHGLAASFVGHPVLESGADRGDAASFRARHALGDAPLLLLMPGSRHSEISRLLPVYRDALALLRARVPGLVAAMPLSANVAEAVRDSVAGWPQPPILLAGLDEKHDAYAAAAAAITKSGTSTLELALAGVPMAVAYRVHPLTAALVRRMITLDHVAMVNVLAGREIVPELLQENCSPERLAAAAAALIGDPAAGATQRDAFRAIVASLAPTGRTPSEAAAAEILTLLDGAPG
ncbi:MAG: lipid-A-disaccharide synthase [Rhodospirillales bacterium]|nr:lipid-A-disaccharide synthase [Rhodospirillales bacterium]